MKPPAYLLVPKGTSAVSHLVLERLLDRDAERSLSKLEDGLGLDSVVLQVEKSESGTSANEGGNLCFISGLNFGKVDDEEGVRFDVGERRERPGFSGSNGHCI